MPGHLLSGCEPALTACSTLGFQRAAAKRTGLKYSLWSLRLILPLYGLFYLWIVVLQKLINPDLFYQFLIVNKVLAIFQPTFCKSFQFSAWKIATLMAVDYFSFFTAQVKSRAFSATLNINFSSRAWILISCICGTTSTKNSTSWNSSLILF